MARLRRIIARLAGSPGCGVVHDPEAFRPTYRDLAASDAGSYSHSRAKPYGAAFARGCDRSSTLTGRLYTAARQHRFRCDRGRRWRHCRCCAGSGEQGGSIAGWYANPHTKHSVIWSAPAGQPCRTRNCSRTGCPGRYTRSIGHPSDGHQYQYGLTGGIGGAAGCRPSHGTAHH